MKIRPWIRLLRSCLHAEMTVRETAVVLWKCRRGAWRAKTNRDVLAQIHYFSLLVKDRAKP